MNILILYNFSISFFMLGLIITTQIVSYPLFLKVDDSFFTIYHQSYVNKISLIAIPIMLSELFVSFILFYFNISFTTSLSFIIIIVIFMSTFFIQVPIHNQIQLRYNYKLIKRLVITNWIRTILWILKSFLSIKLFYKELI